MLRCSVNTSRLERAVADIAYKFGVDGPKLLRNVVASVIRGAVAGTKVPNGAKLSREARFRANQESFAAQGHPTRKGARSKQAPGMVRFNTTTAVGRGWFRLSDATGIKATGKKVRFLRVAENYQPIQEKGSSVGAGLLALMAREADRVYNLAIEKRAAGARAAGLAAKSWLDSAASLGIDMALFGGVTSKIRKALSARASNGRSYKNGYGHSAGSGYRTVITITNTLPYGERIKTGRILNSAIKRQERSLMHGVKNGAYTSLAGVIRKYPGMRIAQ